MKLLRNGIWGYPNLSFWIIVTQNISKINHLLFPVRWELWFSCQHHHHERAPKALPPNAIPNATTRRLHFTWFGERIIQAFILDRIVKSRTDKLSPQRRPTDSLTEFTAIFWVETYLSDSRDSGWLLMQLQSGCVSTISFTFLILFHLAPLPSTLYFKDHPRHRDYFILSILSCLSWSVDHWPHMATIRFVSSKSFLSVQGIRIKCARNPVLRAVYLCCVMCLHCRLGTNHWAGMFHLLSYHARPANTAQRTWLRFTTILWYEL